jgi:hypothetical protein
MTSLSSRGTAKPRMSPGSSQRIPASASRSRRIALALASCGLLALGGCGSDDDGNDKSAEQPQSSSAASSNLPQGSEPVKLDPADFTTRIDNPYWPMKTGTKWVYSGEEGGEKIRIEVTVTDKKKTVEGVDAVVLQDAVRTEAGDPIEITDDWYAQDSKGNVWYLGEDTKEYENGKVSSTSGSWEHGVDGAYAGIIMPARPKPGVSYRQEYYKGEAEDEAKVIGLPKTAKVRFGTFDDCVETEDTTPLEPDVVEHKFYARNVGPVLKETPSGGGREELISFTRG